MFLSLNSNDFFLNLFCLYLEFCEKVPNVLGKEVFVLGEGWRIFWEIFPWIFMLKFSLSILRFINNKRVKERFIWINEVAIQELLLSDKDEITTMISTPELNSAVVKSIICLFYTGRVNISWEMIGEVNTALKLLGWIHSSFLIEPQFLNYDDMESSLDYRGPYNSIQYDSKCWFIDLLILGGRNKPCC